MLARVCSIDYDIVVVFKYTLFKNNNKDIGAKYWRNSYGAYLIRVVLKLLVNFSFLIYGHGKWALFWW